MIPLKVKCVNYDLSTELFKSNILVDMWDGGKARIQHRRIEVTFTHKVTKDKVMISMSKKGVYYFNNDFGKNIRMTEDETKEEFVRLVGDKDEGIIAFKVALCRMIVTP